MTENYKVSSTVLGTAYGEFEFYCFCWGPHEEDNILCARKLAYGDAPLLRVQSACYTAEIFRSHDCDCHEQLHESLRVIGQEGGLLVYMLCDGRGAGLYQKVLGLELGRTAGLDTSDAYRALGLEQDPRSYERACAVLAHFGIDKVHLLTNNPRKVNGLEQGGIEVVRVPLQVAPTPASRPYLLTKKLKMGHVLEIP
jgi:GTP cyclohydrolase II